MSSELAAFKLCHCPEGSTRLEEVLYWSAMLVAVVTAGSSCRLAVLATYGAAMYPFVGRYPDREDNWLEDKEDS